MKKYNIIYADPPWNYKDKRGNYCGREGIKSGGAAIGHYKTMTNEEIYNLSIIKDLSKKDCVLFLWVTSPFLPIGIETIKRWGFEYKTVGFCWSKKHKNGKSRHNIGQWTRGSVELCLLATKGKPHKFRKQKNIKQLVEDIVVQHSQKPDEIRKRIEQLFGNLPRIELFARQKTNGWDTWGGMK